MAECLAALEALSLDNHCQNPNLKTIEVEGRQYEFFDLSKVKNFHKLQKVRPDKVHEAILYLKDNHPSYANIDVSSLDEWHSNFLTGEQEQTKCPGEKEDDACNNENPDDSSQIAEGTKEKSIYNFATCLIPEDPLTDVVGMIYF